MNVYKCISEQLTEYIYIDEGLRYPEPYSIAVMVAAPTRSRAKWLAWQSDESSRTYPNMPDMPKFEIKMIRKNEDWPEGVLPEGFYHLWTDEPRAWLIPEATLVERFIAETYEAEYDDWWKDHRDG